MKTYDIIIIGAGASGIFAAGHIKNKSVCILDAGSRPLRRVAISGGGKCNFTNISADYKHYFGKNPNFTRSALAVWTPTDMLNWAHSHNIKTFEKSPGQYFAHDATDIINALLNDANKTDIVLNTNVLSATKSSDIFEIKTNTQTFFAKHLCIATGGISYTNISSGDIGYKIAKSFGHKIIPPRPALCGIKTKIFDSNLSGISTPVEITINREKITDNMLFTHWGIGGPAIYRTSVRDINNGFTINLLPNCDIENLITTQKQINGRRQIKTILSQQMPERLVEFLIGKNTKNIADWTTAEIKTLTEKMIVKIAPNEFELQKFDSAEITRGGIDTTDISSKTMESKLCRGLYFIGECLDIAGDLGGYNLQWSWASATAMAKNFEQ
jgi:hypothetical protein